jgi:hypothetical protein
MDTGDRKPFTVWSGGELVGETHLDYLANTSEVKFGDFTATELGERIIAIRMSPRKALCAHAPWKEIQALHACREAVPLELRAPDGREIPTEDIEITDLEWLASLRHVGGDDESWEDDLRFAEADLMEELQSEPLFRDELMELLPANSAEFADELLTDDLWTDDCAEPTDDNADSPPVEFPRYQIQVHIKGGG